MRQFESSPPVASELNRNSLFTEGRCDQVDVGLLGHFLDLAVGETKYPANRFCFSCRQPGSLDLPSFYRNTIAVGDEVFHVMVAQCLADNFTMRGREWSN